jgi:hypothetical protein
VQRHPLRGLNAGGFTELMMNSSSRSFYAVVLQMEPTDHPRMVGMSYVLSRALERARAFAETYPEACVWVVDPAGPSTVLLPEQRAVA